MVRSDNRTTVPQKPQKSPNGSYKKKVCLISRLFPLGAGRGDRQEGPAKFWAQNFFAFKSPKTFGLQAKAAFATRSVALLHEL
jgi:hypothetical protein